MAASMAVVTFSLCDACVGETKCISYHKAGPKTAIATYAKLQRCVVKRVLDGQGAYSALSYPLSLTLQTLAICLPRTGPSGGGT